MTVSEHVRMKVAYPCCITPPRFRKHGFRVSTVCCCQRYTFPPASPPTAWEMGEFIFCACPICSFMIGFVRFFAASKKDAKFSMLPIDRLIKQASISNFLSCRILKRDTASIAQTFIIYRLYFIPHTNTPHAKIAVAGVFGLTTAFLRAIMGLIGI